MTKTTNPTLNQCSGCTKCCFTHPCALEPKDLANIARHLWISETELFNQFLVLDYVEKAGLRQYYVSPARKADKPGTMVKPDWTFSESPCIFLNGASCSIQQAKPRGSATYYCSLLTSSGQELVGYSKKKSAADWSTTIVLKELLELAAKNSRIRSNSS